MAFGNPGAHGGHNSTPMTEINIIPLVDVMLVLLVIFIITAPLLTHSVRIDLPQASSQPAPPQSDSVQLAIDANNTLFWNGEAIDRSQLIERLHAAGQQQPVPELHLRADKAARYEIIAEAMSLASKAGISRIGFVTEPEPSTASPH